MPYKKTYGGAVYLSFGDSQIMLTAADLSLPRFTYIADSFYTAVSLGQIDAAVTTIAGKFEGATGIDTKSITDKIKDLSNMPVLGQILTSELVITEFVIQPETVKDKADGKYSFGFGLRLTKDNTLGPVKLDGVAFNVTLNQTAA